MFPKRTMVRLPAKNVADDDYSYSLLLVFSQKLKNLSLNRKLVRAKNQCSQTEQ